MGLGMQANSMLAIHKSKRHKGKCSPNNLPCRIQHNGPARTLKRYWNVKEGDEGKIVAYFRGRKLHGKKLRLPKGYKGIVVSATDRIMPKQPSTAEVEEEAEQAMDVKLLKEQAEFGDFIVWGHEALPDELADPYVRGVEEWIALAEELHSQFNIWAEKK